MIDSFVKQEYQYLLRFVDQLDERQHLQLQKQLETVDWGLMKRLASTEGNTIDWAELARRAEPAPAIELHREHERVSRAEAIEHGESLLRDGKVAMVLAAGGQGTRLGFDKPKGLFPIGPISNKSLLQILVEKAIGTARYFGAAVPVLVMTSPVTHQATVDFLTQENWFGLPDADRFVFCQGTMPAIDAETGQLLLSGPGQLALSPNGHGGMVDALASAGCIDSLKNRGVECLFYGQVDNPLLQVCDPLTLGYHRLLGSEMTSQVVRKMEGLQKVGNVVSIDGKIQIIEYSDLPQEFANQENEKGQLKLWAGSIAVHVFELEFLQKMVARSDQLPFHRAHKKVPFLDQAGELISPDEPNAIKFEKFIFDLLPHAKNALAIEINAEDGFAAVKNALPAKTETPETSRQAMVDLHRRWLEHCGVHVEPEIEVEISPLFAINAKQLAEKSSDINAVLEPTLFEENSQ